MKHSNKHLFKYFSNIPYWVITLAWICIYSILFGGLFKYVSCWEEYFFTKCYIQQNVYPTPSSQEYAHKNILNRQ